VSLEFTNNFFKAKDEITFCRIGDATIKEGIFDGFQIRELIQDVKIEDQLS
jgi:hypothetical protein